MDDFVEDALQSIEDQVGGQLLFPADQAYRPARTVWNDRIDDEPAAILKCRRPADIATAIRIAGNSHLRLSVKGGGHHVSGSAVADGGLMLDLSPMNAVHVDQSSRTVRVEAGATWGEVDEACQSHGLVVPGSQAPSVGVAGLTLGGGRGWLSPQYGLTSDNLLSAEVVTATGAIIEASEATNPDLFWALRGGGGNFGVVTEFEFQLHEFDQEILAGSLIYDPAALPELLARYESFMADAPLAVRPLLGLIELPPASYYPERVHNERVLLLILFYGGEPSEGEAVLEPLREFGDPVADSIRPRGYFRWQRVGDATAVKRTFVRSQFIDMFSEGALETIRNHGTDVPSSDATVFVSPRHGAEVEPSVDKTAYPHRSPSHHVLIETRWSEADSDEANLDWTRTFHQDLRPYTTGAAEVNFLTADEIPERVPAVFGENYERLVEVKTKWDPANVFRMNPNIQPDTR